MFRKVLAATTAAIFVSLTLTVPSASAATKISNGVPCTKAGTTKKVSGFNYRCAKNALVKNSKLTWLSVECLDSVKAYQGAVKAQAQLNGADEQIKTLNTNFESVTARLAATTAALDTAKVQIETFKTKLNATTNVAEKQSLAAAVSKLAGAIITLSSAKTRLSTEVRELDKSRALLTTAPQKLKTAAADAKENANLLCTKGF